jgi:hypothetical protein
MFSMISMMFGVIDYNIFIFKIFYIFIILIKQKILFNFVRIVYNLLKNIVKTVSENRETFHKFSYNLTND